MINMYYIEKVPTPRGYKKLNAKVEVTKIEGAGYVYSNDGELRAKYEGKIQDSKALSVLYTIYYNDETQKEFIAYENVSDEQRDYSLSKAPIILGEKKYVTKIEVTVQ